MAALHYSYMNFIGESYTLIFRARRPFVPTQGQLPDALQELPAHQSYFKLGDNGRFSDSTIKYNNVEYPIGVFIRDINPNPASPLSGMIERFAPTAA